MNLFKKKFFFLLVKEQQIWRKNSISLKIVKSPRRENVDISLNFAIWRLIFWLQNPDSKKNIGEAFRALPQVEKPERPPFGWHAIPEKKDRKKSVPSHMLIL